MMRCAVGVMGLRSERRAVYPPVKARMFSTVGEMKSGAENGCSSCQACQALYKWREFLVTSLVAPSSTWKGRHLLGVLYPFLERPGISE